MATSACNIDSCPPENDTRKNDPVDAASSPNDGGSSGKGRTAAGWTLGSSPRVTAEGGGDGNSGDGNHEEETAAGAVSRRFLFSAAATVPALGLALPVLAAPPTADADLNVALLAERYQRSADALSDWIERVEYRYGCDVEEQPEHRARYKELCDRQDRSIEALALARPSSVRGVVFKLRPAFYCDSLYRAEDYHMESVLRGALCDLERLAAGPA